MWRGAWLVVGVVGALGCSSPRRAPDVGGDASVAALCGNGTRDPGEECDDGTATGTSASTCSVQCKVAHFLVAQWPFEPLDLTPTHVIRVDFPGHFWSGLAYSDAASASVHVMPETGEPYSQTGAMPPVVTFPTTAPPLALGSLRKLPLWIEPGAAVGAFRMFYGELGANDTPVVHEIPYPFPSGTRPQLVESTPAVSAVLVDVDPAPPHDLLVAVIVLRSDDTLATTTFHTASPGAAISTIGTTTTNTDANADLWEQQLVVFFDDPGSFVSLRIELPYQDLELGNVASAYAISEIARGAWPFHVIASTSFIEQCTETMGAPAPVLRNPAPLAVLTSDGDILVWQFTRGLDAGETFATPYGSPGPSARVVGSVQMEAVWGVWALGTDGAIAFYGDSDCTSLESPALKPQVFALGAGPPAVVSAVGIPSLSFFDGIDFALGPRYFSATFGETAF